MEHAWENLRDEAHSVVRAGRRPSLSIDKRDALDMKYERCCESDVHKKTLVACAIAPGAKGGEVEEEPQTYATRADDRNKNRISSRSLRETIFVSPPSMAC
jgi:hypothetical protein